MKLNSKEKDEELAEKFNCTKCTVKLVDIKLQMFNFWKVVISEQDMLAANSVLAKQSFKSSNLINEQQTPFNTWKVVISEQDMLAANSVLAKQSVNSSNIINEQSTSYLTTEQNSYKSIAKKNNYGSLVNKKKLQHKRSKTFEKENNIDDEDDDIYKNDTFNLSQTENIFDKLDSLTDHDITYFNFTQVDDPEMKKVYKKLIDESVLLEQFKQEKNANDFDLKKNQIVWCQWKTKGFSIWWPAIVVKVVTSKNLSPRVYFRYYERIKKYGGLFGTDITKVEPFYWSTERHSYYKHLATQFKPQRYEFFFAYTNALVDFVKQSQEDEKGDESSDVDMNASEDSITEPVHSNSTEPKYLVNGQMLTHAKIAKLANKKPSKKTRRLIRERKKLSKSLIDLILSQDCKDYVISIIENKIECSRSLDYLNGTNTTRKRMRLSSTGPLLETHQNEVKNFLNQLSSRNLANKPNNLENYNNDVLYPEAVIWAIKIHCQLSDKKSARKFHSGLGITKWETLKEKCIEFLNKNPTISHTQSYGNNQKMPTDKQNDLNSSLSHTEDDESEYENNANVNDTLTSSDRKSLLSISPSSDSQMMCEDEDSNDYDDDVYSYEYDLVDQTKKNRWI